MNESGENAWFPLTPRSRPFARCLRPLGLVILSLVPLQAAAAQESPAGNAGMAAGSGAGRPAGRALRGMPHVRLGRAAAGMAAERDAGRGSAATLPGRGGLPAPTAGTPSTAAVATAPAEPAPAAEAPADPAPAALAPAAPVPDALGEIAPADPATGKAGAPEPDISASAAMPDTSASAATPDTTAGAEKPGLSAGGVSAGMPVWKLLVVDARSVFTAPAHWTGRDWGLFSLEVAAVVGIGTADRTLRHDVLRGPNATESNLAETFRPLGTYASFGVLGGVYLGGVIAHDARAQETALDGLIASAIAAGVITPVLKEVTGRSRPASHKGTYDFHPFSGNASFPSGEATQAFAVGAVIAAEYPNVWVEILSYGLAGIVGFARMREDAHFASDVLAGALIGNGVGRAVVRINKRLRARVAVAPLISPHAHGLTLVTGF
jgi:membrane-associated phospholipid phosphatase